MNHELIIHNGHSFFIEGDPKLSKKRINEEGFETVENLIEAISIYGAGTEMSRTQDYDSFHLKVKLSSGEITDAYVAFYEFDLVKKAMLPGAFFQEEGYMFFNVKPLHLKHHGIDVLTVCDTAELNRIVDKESEVKTITARDLVIGNYYKVEYSEGHYVGKYYLPYKTKNNDSKVGMVHVFVGNETHRFQLVPGPRIKQDVQVIKSGKPNMKKVEDFIDLFTLDIDGFAVAMLDGKTIDDTPYDMEKLFSILGLPKNESEYTGSKHYYYDWRDEFWWASRDGKGHLSALDHHNSVVKWQLR